MNMEKVGDLKPTKTQPEKCALPEEMGDEKKENTSVYGKRLSTGDIIEGKRQKKTVQRLDFSVAKPKERVKIEQGTGDKLGDIIRVAYFIGKMKIDELKPLHKVIFDRPGAAASVKKNIRQFSGFLFEADSQPYRKKREKMKRFTNSVLKNMCYVLDLERSGTHDTKIDRILAFLLDPKMSGRNLPKKKRKTKNSKRKAQRSNRKKNVPEDGKSMAIVTDSSTDDDDNKEQDGQGDEDQTEKSAPAPKSRETISDDEDDSSDDVVNKDSDEEVKHPKVVKKTAPKKKPAPAKPAPVKPGLKTKKADSSSGRRKKANTTSVVSDLDNSSDDEPLAKVARKPLTDEKLKETVKSLLKEANLEKVTMKQICKQVFETYPDYDLSSRKDYIKQTVKQLLS
ncbi:hypothetical protein SKAU_G00215170 [Synaphobranchus kaupii]|uniref:DEK-C domain-containing protein n=1 Tax=Synaphobranchus kaupii TaxID=118154 RepID=A0A9Q1F9S9_SYNKA|nr:hypothetical protein SKAU_G00215170 [Synaphobranchus kaupii]